MVWKEELVNIVGNDDFIDDQDTLTSYSRDESFARSMVPRAVVKPSNTAEVESVIKWANQTGTPLVPVSSGPPHFRGDCVPSVPGAVIVDLSKMRRILKIDRRNKISWIEPGVTWTQLLTELAKEGLTIPMPLIPRNSKSVIGSLLEREPMIVPKYHWSMLEPLRCCEVVWGSGDKMWTGEAGDQSGTLEERWSKFLYQVNPMGPYQTDFYRFFSAAQGSMGIVTCATVKCEVMPQIHKLFFMKSENLNTLIELAYKILRIRYGYELFIANKANLAMIAGNNASEIKDIKEKLPTWTLVVGIAGLERLPEEKVKYQEKEIQEIAQQQGLSLESTLPGINPEQLLETLSNPARDDYWKLRYKGGSQDIFFITTLNRTPEFINQFLSISQHVGYPSQDIGVYLQPVMQGVACHCEFVCPFNADDEGEANLTRDLINASSRKLMKQGAFFSRPYGDWADMVYSEDIQNTAGLKKLKNIFDPKNIMNPGKLCFK